MSHHRIIGGCLLLLSLSPGSAGAQEWKPFSSKEGGFKVLMPGAPEVVTKKSAKGVQFTFFVLQSGNGTYLVAINEVPQAKGEKEEQLQLRLDSGRDEGLRQAKGKLLREKKIRLAGDYPGRELEVELPDGEGLVLQRFYIANGKTYQVVVIGPEALVRSKDSLKFLDSFELVK